MAIYKCKTCETIYDEEKEGVNWDELAEDWACHVYQHFYT